MSDLEIRFARPDDEIALRRFIDNYWATGHVLATSQTLFHWQHGRQPNDPGFNYVLGTNAESGEIYGILGFIPMQHFDPALPFRDTFLTMWKVRADVGVTGLGIRMMRWLTKSIDSEINLAVGLSQMVIPIYQRLGYQTGVMSQHVLLNATRTEFRIAKGVPAALLSNRGSHSGSNSLPTGLMTTLDAGVLPDQIPSSEIDALCAARLLRKSWRYLCGRYTDHPAYQYRFSFVIDDARVRCLLVWRKISRQGSAVLRVVDLLGDESSLAACGGDLQRLLQQEQAEYLDVQHFGVDESALLAAGFSNRKEFSDLMIPGYFEPLVEKNIDLDFAFQVFNPSIAEIPVRILRGDTDQDRPNQMST